jgi:Zn-dependent protease with chaperone function
VGSHDRVGAHPLQRRADAIAASVFVPPAWPLPIPTVLVDPHLPRRNRATATTRGGRMLIRVHPRVLDEPIDVVRGTLAHEGGHIMLGRRCTHTGWTLIVAIPLWSAAIACCVMGIHQARTAQTSLWFGLALLPTLLALRLVVIPSQLCELRADRLSTTLVGAVVVVRTLECLTAETQLTTRFAAAAGMDSHPLPRQRLRHLAKVEDIDRHRARDT